MNRKPCSECKRPFPSPERMKKARERAAKWYANKKTSPKPPQE